MTTAAMDIGVHTPRTRASRVPLWFLFFVGVALAAAAGVGTGVVITREASGASGTLCQDALMRRRGAESALLAPPNAAGTADAQALSNVKWDEARKEAVRLLEISETAVAQRCF
jgi:hypothetical protein